MTPPRKRNKSNTTLPARWRQRYGSYTYRVPPEDAAHWDNKKEFTLGKSLAEAHRVYAERLAAIAQSEHAHVDEREFATMGMAIDRYIATVTPTKAKATRRPELQMLGKLRAIWGDMRPEEITPVQINRVKHLTSEQISPETANHHLRILSTVFTAAIEWGAVASHPMTGKKVTRLKVKKKTHRIPTNEELALALTAASPMLEAYVQIKLRTGLRQTDMLKLERGNISDGVLRVQLQKSENTTERVLLFEITPDLNKWIRAALAANRHKVQSRYLFQTRDGGPYIDDNDDASSFHSAWQRWQKKVVALGVEKFAERYFRNKAAQDSESDQAAQQLLGHEVIGTTKKYYRSNESKVVPLKRED